MATKKTNTTGTKTPVAEAVKTEAVKAAAEVKADAVKAVKTVEKVAEKAVEKVAEKAAFGRRSGAAEKEGGCAGWLDYGRYCVGIGAVFA